MSHISFDYVASESASKTNGKIKNAVTPIDTVNENLRRAQAITDLVGAASRQSQVEIDESIRDVMLIVWELADSANTAANSLFELMQQEQEEAQHG